MKDEQRCYFCGGVAWELRRVNYIYRHGGKYMLVPNTPAEVCLTCRMEYYAAKVVQEIEEHFEAIEQQEEIPSRIIQMPVLDIYEKVAV